MICNKIQFRKFIFIKLCLFIYYTTLYYTIGPLYYIKHCPCHCQDFKIIIREVSILTVVLSGAVDSC